MKQYIYSQVFEVTHYSLTDGPKVPIGIQQNKNDTTITE